MSEVELRSVQKTFSDGKTGETAVLQNVNLRVRSGEFAVLLGPSGCGKSTSLRIIAGLELATSGDVLIDGRRVNETPASRRGIAMVFQNYALYPHLTVLENIVFGLRVRRTPKAERERRGREAAEKLGLTAYLNRKPAQLSGGQRQRAALGRALVTDAKVVLMDEPLSNLDAKLRHQMRIELRTLQQELGLTVVYVTHDQVEAMTMADHVVVMRAGRIVQAADPVTLYREPADAEVAAFIGSPPMNIIQASRNERGVEIDGVAQRVAVDVAARVGGALMVGIRPESLRLDPVPGGIELISRIRMIEVLGAETLLTVDLSGGQSLVTRLPGIVPATVGENVRLHAHPDDLHFFDNDSGLRLTGDSFSPRKATA